MLNNWFIMKNKEGKHIYLCGELSDYSLDDLEGLEKVSENEITADDYAYIFGEILEDNNRHSLTNLGDIYLESLRNVVTLSKKEEIEAITSFINLFFGNKV